MRKELIPTILNETRLSMKDSKDEFKLKPVLISRLGVHIQSVLSGSNTTVLVLSRAIFVKLCCQCCRF